MCGTCWQLVYVSNGVTKNVTITAVDAAYSFNIGKGAFTALAGSAGIDAGSVVATAVQVAPAKCGIV